MTIEFECAPVTDTNPDLICGYQNACEWILMNTNLPFNPDTQIGPMPPECPHGMVQLFKKIQFGSTG